MNIYDLTNSREVFVLVNDIADILRCDPQNIRNQARTNPDALGFPVTVVGSAIKIPRIPFLRFIGVETVNKHEM